jgi:predicted enzyme related to lactoylglutathione lyase
MLPAQCRPIFSFKEEPMTGPNARGRFVHYDLMTSDVDEAVDFYTRLAGWGTMPWQGEGEPYIMWTNEGVPLGGVMPLPDEAKEVDAPPHWIAYVMVPDTRATVAQTERLGGSVIVPATDIPDIGSFAILHDPQGGAFAIFTPIGEVPGNDDPPKVGEFSWHELATSDWEAAFGFYNKVFGWEKTEAMDLGKLGTYQMYGRAGISLGGIFNKPDEVEGPPEWLYYIMVREAGEAAVTVQMLGGQVMNGPIEVPGGGQVAHCLDPLGGRFAIQSK